MTYGDASRGESIDRIKTVYRARMADGRERDPSAQEVPRRADHLRWNAYHKFLARNGLFPMGQRDVLDVGCQWGTWLRRCQTHWGHTGGRLCGVELMPEWVELAAVQHPNVEVVEGSADRIPFDDCAFDLLHQGMVFSSVRDTALRQAIAADITRVLRPGGFLIWYDFFFNPINPDTVDMTLRRVRRLFPGWTHVDRARITLAPILARRVERVWARAVDALTALRVLNLHYLILLRKPEGA